MTDRTTSFGDVTLDRVDEWIGKLFTRPGLLPDSDRQAWEAERAWLEPDFWSADSEDAWACAQSFLVHSGGRTILVDTGIGNAKPRPGIPPFDHLDTAYLDNLAAMGVRPADVDLVVCTHLHPDHVGWNTTLVDGEWRPTFSNATYLLPKADFDHLAELAKSGDTPDPMGNVAAFRDSVLPVVENAKTQLWEGEEHVIDDALRLVASPGHSPGACVLTISSGARRHCSPVTSCTTRCRFWTRRSATRSTRTGPWPLGRGPGCSGGRRRTPRRCTAGISRVGGVLGSATQAMPSASIPGRRCKPCRSRQARFSSHQGIAAGSFFPRTGSRTRPRVLLFGDGPSIAARPAVSDLAPARV